MKVLSDWRLREKKKKKREGGGGGGGGGGGERRLFKAIFLACLSYVLLHLLVYSNGCKHLFHNMPLDKWKTLAR